MYLKFTYLFVRIRFDINLQTGPGGEIAGEDVALHASVRLTEGYIARNTFQGGCWQEELGEGGMPIQGGQRFEFLLLCEAFDYKVRLFVWVTGWNREFHD